MIKFEHKANNCRNSKCSPKLFDTNFVCWDDRWSTTYSIHLKIEIEISFCFFHPLISLEIHLSNVTWASSRNFIKSLTGTFRAWAFKRKFRSSVIKTTSRCNRIAPSVKKKLTKFNEILTIRNKPTFVRWKEISRIVVTLKLDIEKIFHRRWKLTYFKQQPKIVSSFDS